MMTPEQIVRDLERTLPVMQEEAERAMSEAVDITHRRMSELAPKGATGALSEKITALTRPNTTGVSGTVRPRVDYAIYVDQGSGVYATFQGPAKGPLGIVQAGSHSAITPKAARGPRARLKFADGRYRRSSRGTKPTHFIERTREQVATEVEDVLTGGAAKASERLFR